jgi:tRNA 2-thiocytidine biosynthesis protein TtcA
MTSLADKQFYRIRKLVGKAIGDFGLIEEGDRIAVAVSGGKDSYTLLHVLEALRKKAPIHYELIAVNIDAGFPGFRTDVIEQHLKTHQFSYRIKTTESYQIIENKRRPGSSYCAFCARLRRGVLYTQATELNCNKIALGHHLDDFVETLLLNQFYVGTLAAMSAKMLADNGQHTVIRPLVYVEEKDIIRHSEQAGYPLVSCSCPVAGGELQQRQKVKQLIKKLDSEIPHIRKSMLSALGNVQPRYLLDPHLSRPAGD